MAAEDQPSAAPPAENGVAADNKNKPSKVDKRKEKKKRQKQNKQQRRQQQAQGQPPAGAGSQQDEDDEQVIIEYVTEQPALDFLQPEEQQEEEDEEAAYGGLGLGLGAPGLGLGATPKPAPPTTASVEDFKRVLERFTLNLEEAPGTSGGGGGEEEEGEEGGAAGRSREAAGGGSGKPNTSDADSDDEDKEGGGAAKQLSRKQRKLLQRLKIAELKQQCARPDVVEVWDVTAPDPNTLVTLKAYRNTVAVPRHWSQKRKYLQGKRGIEKPPFQLPDFIEATGISAMRQAYQEKEEAKKMKQKQRDRMQPKVGKLDIDYAVLHDAFFKHQRPPKFSGMGEVYYEGKEYEAAIADLHPGRLSAELQEALGMGDPSTPPPWLINMQRYGPPPSYPNLKIPGLNAPIPPGASFGYHPGGWGKPPVDETGQPLYGDVFGVWGGDADSDEEVDKGGRWGQLEPELEESSEEEEEEEEGSEQPPEPPPEGYQTEMLAGGIATDLTGLASSLPSGLETPDASLALRKGDSVAGMDTAPQPLYRVLETRKAEVGSGTLLGTDHVYVVPGAEGGAGGGRKAGKRPGGAGDVEVTLAPEELEGLDEAAIRALYEERVAAARAANAREDFSDMVAEHNAAAKRKAAGRADARAAKKQKDFKF